MKLKTSTLNISHNENKNKKTHLKPKQSTINKILLYAATITIQGAPCIINQTFTN